MPTPASPKPLSERRLKYYLNKDLLSLPDDVLIQIASHLLPLPPQNPPTVKSLKHALSLALTCRRFHRIVTSRLHTLDFVAPSSYTTISHRTPEHVSHHLERFINSAANYLRDLRLPQGYLPVDRHYTAIRACKHLKHLSLPVTRELDSTEAQQFFSSFESLESVTLDLPSRSFIFGLLAAPPSLKQVTLTKFPAEHICFTALSPFLAARGKDLTSLSINMICDDVRKLYHTIRPWQVCGKSLLTPFSALPRLGSILQQHVERNELHQLRELHVSTVPDFPPKASERYHLRDMHEIIALFARAIQTARLENPEPTGLRKLRLKAPIQSGHVCIAFMSAWVDPGVEVEISFCGSTTVFPRVVPNGTVDPKVTEVTLAGYSPPLHDALPNAKAEVETLTIARDFSTVSFNVNAPDLLSLIRGNTVRRLKIAYDLPKTSLISNRMSMMKDVIEFPPTLETLEIPADVVLFSVSLPRSMSMVLNSRNSIKILRLCNFRDCKITLPYHSPGSWAFPVRQIFIEDVEEKATWFVKGLPPFLFKLRRDFPKLELLYMEQTSVNAPVVDRKDIFRALLAIDHFEKSSGADASTLRTEIVEWRSRPHPDGRA